jgi:hypothetical protein
MSSPIHHAKDVDAALMYAPPWAREEGQAAPLVPDALAADEERSRLRIGNGHRTFSGDVALMQLRKRLALEPKEVPAPPRPAKRHRAATLIALRFFGLTGAAALIAWALVSLPGTRLNRDESAAVNSVAASISVAAGKQDQLPTAQVQTPVSEGRRAVDEPAAAAIELQKNPVGTPGLADLPLMHLERPTGTAPPRTQLETLPIEVPASQPTIPGAAPAPQPTLPDSAVQRLDEGEIATLIKRGEDFLKNADLVAARMLFRRAAEAGSAKAALALGRTFDPFVIQQLGAIGVGPDIAKAREWYQKAEALGSETASQQLAKLTQSR